MNLPGRDHDAYERHRKRLEADWTTLTTDPAYIVDVGDYADPEADSFLPGDRLERANAGVPRRYRNAAPTEQLVANWVKHLVKQGANETRAPLVPRVNAGMSIVITGPVGVGKTHQAFGAIRALYLAGMSGRFRYVSEGQFLADIRSTYGSREGEDEVLSQYASEAVLMLDDLGVTQSSEWAQGKLFDLLDARYWQDRPTLITTNLSEREMLPALGQRVTSRIFGMSTRLTMEGEDRRLGGEWNK